MFQHFVALDHLPEFDLQQSGKIGIRSGAEFVQGGAELRVRGTHGGAANVTGVEFAVPGSRAPEITILAEADQRRLESVVVPFVDRLDPANFGAQASGRSGVSVQGISFRLAASCGEVGKLVHLTHEVMDAGVAAERDTTPGSRKVPPRRQGPTGVAQTPCRPILGSRRFSPQRASQALGWVLESHLQPALERFGIQPLRFRLGQHPKLRIDARLHGPLAQQLGTEAVDRVDAGLFQPGKSIFEVPPCRRGRRHPVSCLLQARAQAQLELSRRLLRKGHRDQAVNRRAPMRQRCDDTIDQLGRLAGAGSRFDDDIVIQRFLNDLSFLSVGERLHGKRRISCRGARRSLALYFTRSSS